MMAGGGDMCGQYVVVPLFRKNFHYQKIPCNSVASQADKSMKNVIKMLKLIQVQNRNSFRSWKLGEKT